MRRWAEKKIECEERGGRKWRNQTVSQLRLVSWMPPDAPKPFLPRQSPTRGEGGTAGEPLSHEKGARRRMRKASPCSIDRREPLMPSIALRGLVKAERVHADKRRNEQAAILAPFLYVGSPNCCGLLALTLFWEKITCPPQVTSILQTWERDGDTSVDPESFRKWFQSETINIICFLFGLNTWK